MTGSLEYEVMKKIKQVWKLVILVICISNISCIKQAPQLPSNKGIEKDKTPDSLLKINHELTIKEDNLLKSYAEKDGSLRKNQLGFWYKIFYTGRGLAIKDSIKCSFDFELSNLKGETLLTGYKEIVIGKKQAIVGMEEGLKMLHKGDSAVFLIPWYLGYGMVGNKPRILPYTSLICRVKLDN